MDIEKAERAVWANKKKQELECDLEKLENTLNDGSSASALRTKITTLLLNTEWSETLIRSTGVHVLMVGKELTEELRKYIEEL